MELRVEDIVEILTPQLLKTWLKNPMAKAMYEAACTDQEGILLKVKKPWSEEESDAYYNVPKNPTNPLIDPLELAEIVRQCIDDALTEWTGRADDGTAKQMIACLPLFLEMSKYLPQVNPSKEYKQAFRGSSLSMTKLMYFVRKTKVNDWKPTTINGVTMMVYTGPAKNQFTYKPHRAVQSWSVSKDAAFNFGNAIIATPLDKTFFFDPEFMAQYGYDYEKETIHFGKQPMKVALLINKNDWMDFRAGKLTGNATLSEDTEVQDEEGTLTIPQI